jgi:hypothetical protein
VHTPIKTRTLGHIAAYRLVSACQLSCICFNLYMRYHCLKSFATVRHCQKISSLFLMVSYCRGRLCMHVWWLCTILNPLESLHFENTFGDVVSHMD